MKFFFLAFLMSVVAIHQCMAQTSAVDTAYIRDYPQKILIQGYVSTNEVLLTSAGKTYQPNYPLNVGLGIDIKNTVINATFDYGVLSLKSNAYGKTNLADFQVHNYGKKFMLDLFIQQYKGFYDDGLGTHPIILYPNLSVSQIGAEGSYIFSGDKFSGKAAFEQSEKQLISAGSFIIGGGAYLYTLRLDSNMLISGRNPIRNFQIGLNSGYGYSWVINDRWLLSGMAKIGINSANEQKLTGADKIKIYPTAFARGSATYQKTDWAVSFLMLINNKSVYAYQNQVQITSVNFQLSYIRHLDGIFKKKKQG